MPQLPNVVVEATFLACLRTHGLFTTGNSSQLFWRWRMNNIKKRSRSLWKRLLQYCNRKSIMLLRLQLVLQQLVHQQQVHQQQVLRQQLEPLQQQVLLQQQC
jgi:hypothetical protein